MTEDDKEFYERLSNINSFENDLKELFKKHNIKLKNEIEQWYGGSTEIIEIHQNGQHWISWNFDETLVNIKVIN